MARIITLTGGRPWGFTMSGGKDFGAPLKISKMTPGGKAAKGGIRFNDYILEINGDTTEGLLHVDAQSMIKATGATLQLKLSNEAPKSPQVQTKFPHEYMDQGSPDHARPRPPPPPTDTSPAPATYTSASYKTTAAVPRKPPTPELPAQPSQINPESGLDSGSSSTQQSPAFRHIKIEDRPTVFSRPPPSQSPPTQRMQNVVIEDTNVKKTSARPPPPSSGPIKVTTTVVKVARDKPIITKPAPPPTITKPQSPAAAGEASGGASPQKIVDRQGMCEACNQPIRGPFASAMGRVWHPEHFTCSSCSKALQNTTFVYEEDKIYCEDCYQNQFAQTCHSCHKPILGPCISAVGLHWHQEHFSCSRCNSDLSKGEGFNMENSLLFCSDCFGSVYGSTCYGCNKKIAGDELWVEALDHQWHPTCFTCESCRKPLEGTTFFAKLGRPFCKSCA